MKKRTIIVSRRQVLRGAGGFTLGLPVLPSLYPVKAYAAEVVPARQPLFVFMMTYNGGVLDSNMFPADSTLTDAVDIVPGHTIRRGKLARSVDGTRASLSPVLSAPASELTDRMVGRMNVLRGLDMPFEGGHASGANLGNYLDSTFGKQYGLAPSPTADMWLAWSPSFYRDLTGVRQRNVITGTYGGGLNYTSYFYADPRTRTGSIQPAGRQFDPVKLFNMLFSGGLGAPASAPGRPPVVDRVLESYRLMRNGNRRLSAVDRQRLDDHMSRLAELQRSLRAGSVVAGGCKDLQPPASGTSAYQRQIDVLTAAFMCGYTRVATFMVGEHDFAGNKWEAGIWHNEIAHNWSRFDAQLLILQAYQNVFRNMFLYLMRKLDVEVAPGTTLLDQALVTWSQECQQHTHSQFNIQVVMAGGAAGAMRTGNFVDYRNLKPSALVLGRQSGLTWNRLLATMMQAMGVPRSEYEKPGSYGFGPQFRQSFYTKAMAPGLWEQSGDFLPLVKA